MADDDRTERPTSRRLQDARRKGQLPRSKEVSDAAQLVAVLIALVWAGPALVRGLMTATREGLVHVGDTPLRTVEPGELTGVAVQHLVTLGTLVGPIALVAAVSAAGAMVAQGGWNIASEALTLNFGRLNPAAGLKRLGLQRAGLDLVRMVLVTGVVSYLAYQAIVAMVTGAPQLGMMPPGRAAEVGWAAALTLLRRSAIALVLFALADFALARWRYTKSLRMTKQEVRDDMRLLEGSPEIKGQIRRRQREMFRKRMLTSVPKATVVITNPTEYAVALQYDRALMSAPVVLAKGRGPLAARIRAIAREHGVPIVENIPLAQALYRGTDVGDQIPGELFGAVAEVLAYLIRLKQLVL